MGRINAIPEGLLDLLKSKTDGVTPKELSETVLPTLSVDGMYFADRLDYQSTTNAPFGQGVTQSITVPQNEVWVLIGWGLFVTPVNAGQNGRISFRLANLPAKASASTTLIGGATWDLPPSATAGFGVFVEGPQLSMPSIPFVLSGGIRIDVRHDAFDPNGAANPSASLWITYYVATR